MLQQYCPLQSFISNSTVYHSLEFWGGGILRLFNPVAWVTLRGFLQLPPVSKGACPHALAANFGFLVNLCFSSFPMEGIKPPLYRWQGSLFWSVGVFHIREVNRHCHSSWHGSYLPISLPPCSVWPCLLWPSSMSGCIHYGVHYLPESMGIEIIPSTLFMWSAATSHYLRSSPILCGHSGRCPWQKL